MCFALLRVDILSSLFPTVSAMSLGVTLTVTVDCIMTFFGSSANDAAFNAWLTDVTDEKNRGAAEGINAIMPLVAILAVFGAPIAVSSYTMAEQMDGDGQLAALLVVITSVSSIVTMFLLIFAMKQLGLV